MVVRYGGDEFIVVMPGSNEEQSKRALERLRRKLDQWNHANLIPEVPDEPQLRSSGLREGRQRGSSPQDR